MKVQYQDRARRAIEIKDTASEPTVVLEACDGALQAPLAVKYETLKRNAIEVKVFYAPVQLNAAEVTWDGKEDYLRDEDWGQVYEVLHRGQKRFGTGVVGGG